MQREVFRKAVLGKGPSPGLSAQSPWGRLAGSSGGRTVSAWAQTFVGDGVGVGVSESHGHQRFLSSQSLLRMTWLASVPTEKYMTGD